MSNSVPDKMSGILIYYHNDLLSMESIALKQLCGGPGALHAQISDLILISHQTNDLANRK